RKIAVVCVGPGVGLMHAKCGSFAAFSAGAKSALGHAGHRINHSIPKLEELLFLLADEWVQLLFAMIQTQQNRRRLCGLLSGFWRTSCALFDGRPPRRSLANGALLGMNLARRSRLPRDRFLCRTLLFRLFRHRCKRILIDWRRK